MFVQVDRSLSVRPTHLRRAITKGFDFLEAEIDGSGAWPSSVYGNLELQGESKLEQVPFVTALGAISLRECGGTRSTQICNRARSYLLSIMEYPGVWRYWTWLPPDLDDTSVCTLLVGSHAWLALGRTLQTVFRKRDEQGRFLTWIVKGDDSADWDDVDSVVNANVATWLQNHPQTEGALRWLKFLIDEERELGSSWYYPNPMDLYAALSRLGSNPTGTNDILVGLGSTLANRIMSCRDHTGHFADTQRTAQALSSLDRLDHWPAPVDANRAVEHLLQSQLADGSWESGLVWQGPPPPSPPYVGFASSVLITAYCIETLSRFAQRMWPNDPLSDSF